MTDDEIRNALSVTEKVNLIKNQSCFTALSDLDSKELALLAQDKWIEKGSTIVNEDELVDFFYLIADGSVEITNTNDNSCSIVGILKKNDAIGLNETGFYSQTGLRTATLTAIEKTHLIGWSLNEFYTFIKAHPAFSDHMKQSAKKMLRMHFIKTVMPFTELSSKQLSHLALSVQEKNVKENDIIFSEGDQGDNCYLICSGIVEITTNKHANDKHILTTLHEGMLFGEMALLSKRPRNTNATMKTDGTLLVIKNEYLQKIMDECRQTADSLILLAFERSRPMKNKNISLHERITDDKEKLFILKNEIKKNYLQLSDIGMTIWEQANGENTIEDITLLIAKKFNVFIPDTITDTILTLTQNEFIIFPLFFLEKNDDDNTSSTKKISLFFKKLILKLELSSADQYISKSYHDYIHYLFKKPLLITTGITSIIGLLTLWINLSQLADYFKEANHLLLIAFFLYITNFLFTMIHELAHAYTTKYFGHEVNKIAFIFYWIGMFSFTDTSDMWLSSKNKRAIVSVAGPFTDTVFAGILSIIALFTTNPDLFISFTLLSLLLYISAFTNLNPNRHGDGCNILSGLLNEHDLKKNASQYINNKLFKCETANKAHCKNAVIYLITCLLFLMLAIIFALTAYYYIYSLLPSSLSTTLKTFISLIPILDVIISFSWSLATLVYSKKTPL